MKRTLFYCRICLFVLAFYPTQIGKAQISDAFTDGDFTQNPAWTGDMGQFTVTADFRLKLASTGTDTSYLFLTYPLNGETEWNFWFRLAFAPSDNNYTRLYLMSNQSDLSQSLDGYFLRYGENGSADGLDLWRQDGNQLTKIIDGIPNPNAASSNQQIRVKVIRSALGEWQLLADYTGGYFFQVLGTVTDNTFITGSGLGVWCKYTFSNAGNFYVDDVYAGPPVIDTDPPSIILAEVLSADTVSLIFSEPLLPDSASNPSNFVMNNGLGTPDTVLYSIQSPDRVKLVFANPMLNEWTYTLLVSDMYDLAGNASGIDSVQLMYYQPSPFDLLITEIFPDPTPVVGLPEMEYIEIYNTKSFAVNIHNWQLQVGNTVRSLPNVEIPAGEYALILGDSIPPAYNGLLVVSISSFPSLTNSGASLRLFSPSGNEINRVDYSDTWYVDSEKEEGGWSLELINVQNYCGEVSNWKASVSVSGGTPGMPNSLYVSAPAPFGISSVTASGKQSLDVYFNQKPDVLQIQPSLFFVNAGIGNPDSILQMAWNRFRLYFSTEFTEEEAYILTISDTLQNCAGELVTGQLSFPFLYYLPKQNDIIITEIMADESPSQGLPLFEYIELYNRAPVPIQISGWQIRIGSSVRALSEFLIQPQSYVCLAAPDAATLFAAPFLPVSGFPSLTNSGMQLSVYSPQGNFIHSVLYADTWHADAYKREGGWSLEMVDLDNPCAGIENWKSAIHPDGGTPGAANSVQGDWPDTENPKPFRLGMPASDTLLVYFSEPLLQRSVLKSSFTVQPGNVQPDSCYIVDSNNGLVGMFFNQTFLSQTAYQLIIVDSISDCIGNQMAKIDTLPFQIPQWPDENDVIVNEVLFNPKGSGKQFVEIYNRSEKYIDLGDLLISEYDSISKQPVNIKTLSENSVLLAPGDYLFLSNSKRAIFYQYFCPFPLNAWEIPSMPSMNNSGGSLALLDENLSVLDAFTFHEDFHYGLLSDPDGVSLERIHPDLPTQSSFNWTSASSFVGFATPGYQNSQSGLVPESYDVLSLYPEVFSPDQDGLDDVLFIRLNFNEPGMVLSVWVYDEKGRKVKQLLNNSYSGMEANLTWDGSTDSGILPGIGVYVLVAEWFHENGKKGRAKKAFVLGTRL